jgi:hypothetical protein
VHVQYKARAPITFRLRQWINRGIRAKGMSKESATWLMTSKELGLRPAAETTFCPQVKTAPEVLYYASDTSR